MGGLVGVGGVSLNGVAAAGLIAAGGEPHNSGGAAGCIASTAKCCEPARVDL